MPNWVQSKITGITKDQLKPYISVSDNEEYLDFNKIIPMPESLLIESDSKLMNGMDMFKKMNLSVELISNMTDEEKETLDLGFKGLYNELNFGYRDWYSWSVTNWGTKWNSHYCIFDDEVMYISTAWSVPFFVFQKLSELLDTEISIVYADEDCGYNTGRLTFSKGELIQDDCPPGASKEAYMNYNEAWDTSLPIKENPDGSYYVDWENE